MKLDRAVRQLLRLVATTDRLAEVLWWLVHSEAWRVLEDVEPAFLASSRGLEVFEEMLETECPDLFAFAVRERQRKSSRSSPPERAEAACRRLVRLQPADLEK